MKSHHILLRLTLLALSCKKDDPVAPTDPTPIYPDSIRAGQETGVGIHYVDFSPDLAFNVDPRGGMLSDSIEIDMDANSTPDFMLTYYHSSFYQLGSTTIDLQIRPLSNNKVCVASDTDLVAPLLLNDSISSSNNWSGSKVLLYSYNWSMSGSSSTDGNFGGNDSNNDHYIGVQIDHDGHPCYGWIHLHGIEMDKYAITTEYFDQ